MLWSGLSGSFCSWYLGKVDWKGKSRKSGGCSGVLYDGLFCMSVKDSAYALE